MVKNNMGKLQKSNIVFETLEKISEYTLQKYN